MLALCSDLDETPSRRVYWETTRFLNTTQQTCMGPGVGLEVGNTIYFDMPQNQFAYWNTDDAGREMVRALIRTGHIDCLHSFGDLAVNRRDAARALDELSRHDCHIRVWIDHGVAPSNFGPDIMRGRGDVPGSDVFHADLTYDYGVRYVWMGRVTSVIGQDIVPRIGGLWSSSHPMASAKTVAKERIKHLLARFGSPKYEMHKSNRLCRSVRLRSGHTMWEFLRGNPHWGGVSHGETADGLAEVLSEAMLERLLARGGYSILYTHLGKVIDHSEPLRQPTRQALNRLASYVRDGRILVTTTQRLLDYCQMVQNARVEVSRSGDWFSVDVMTGSGSDVIDVQGLSLYVPDPQRTRLTVNGYERQDVKVNPPDATGFSSVSVEWRALTFPDQKYGL